MRRTSSRCSIRLDSGQNGRCTQIIEHSRVTMSRYLDTSTKTSSKVKNDTEELEQRRRAALGRVRQDSCQVRDRSSPEQRLLQRHWRPSHSCQRDGLKSGSGRFPRKFLISCQIALSSWIACCPPNVSGLPHQGAPQVREVAPMKCCECASMTPRYSSSSSGQLKIAQQLPCQKQPQSPHRVRNRDSSAETRRGSTRHCNRHFFPKTRCKDFGPPFKRR